MHHIHFNFFRQLLELHIISGALYFDYMFGIQKNIGPHGMIPGIFTDFSPCKWIKRFQISIKQMLNIISFRIFSSDSCSFRIPPRL